MENNNYTVYMHICPNNKKYIGITKNKPQKRWGNGNNYKQSVFFYNAIKKYGWKNIKHIILFTNLSKETAEKLEQELIQKYKSNHSQYGYNIQNGGNINCVNEKTKKILSQKLKGKHNSPNTEFKKGNCRSLRKGVVLTQETKDKISKSKKGKKIKETQNYKKFGKDNHFYGKHHTEQTKKILSLKAKGRKSTRRKAVQCIDTGKIYDCIYDAAKEYKTTITCISRACSGQRKTFKKMHWKFYNNKEEK